MVKAKGKKRTLQEILDKRQLDEENDKVLRNISDIDQLHERNLDQEDLAERLKDVNFLSMKELIERNSFLAVEKRKKRRQVRKNWDKIRKESMQVIKRSFDKQKKHQEKS